MPSEESSSTAVNRRTFLAAFGACTVATAGAASGYRLLSEERDAVETTRRLTVDDEFDLDDTALDPAGDDGPDGGEISQRCDPDPDRWGSISHTANLTMIDAWNERYSIWGSDDSEEHGIDVQNSVAVEKAPERVDGSYLYGVRLYSLCHVDHGRLSRVRLERMENELSVHPEIELRTVLPSDPIDPEDGVCYLTLLIELSSGWNAGYERSWWVDEGRIETERDDDRVTLSFDGDTSTSVAMGGLLELRTDRPLTAYDELFAWRVRGDATRRGW